MHALRTVADASQSDILILFTVVYVQHTLLRCILLTIAHQREMSADVSMTLGTCKTLCHSIGRGFWHEELYLVTEFVDVCYGRKVSDCRVLR